MVDSGDEEAIELIKKKTQEIGGDIRFYLAKLNKNLHADQILEQNKHLVAPDGDWNLLPPF